MNKLAQAYKIGSKLALSKYLPKLSRKHILALGGVGGLGALGLGLSAAEGKVLAKSLADDVVGALPKVAPEGTPVAKELASKVAPGIVGPPSQVARDHALKKIEEALKASKNLENEFIRKGYSPAGLLARTGAWSSADRLPRFNMQFADELKAQFKDHSYLKSKIGPLWKDLIKNRAFKELHSELGKKLERMNIEDLTSLQQKLRRAAPEDIGQILQPYDALASKEYVAYLDGIAPRHITESMENQHLWNQLNAFNRQRLAAENLNASNEVSLLLARLASRIK